MTLLTAPLLLPIIILMVFWGIRNGIIIQLLSIIENFLHKKKLIELLSV